MKTVYLVLAITGAVVPFVFFSSFVDVHGFGFNAFMAAVFENDAAAGVFADLQLSSFVFWLYMFSRPAAPKPWLFIAINLLIGLSCALPAYLYADARSRSI